MTGPSDFDGKIIEEFRANAGKVGGPFAGSDILLLHHTGARTGAERDVIWARQKERAPHFAQYEQKAAPRKIPVILLDPLK